MSLLTSKHSISEISTKATKKSLIVALTTKGYGEELLALVIFRNVVISYAQE